MTTVLLAKVCVNIEHVKIITKYNIVVRFGYNIKEKIMLHCNIPDHYIVLFADN